MTLRDELAAVLGPGNDDITAYAQADSVIEVLNKYDADRSEAGDTPWDQAVARLPWDDVLAALARRRVYPPHQGPEQAEAWERVIAHPALQPCHDEDRPLLDAVLARLDRYEKLDDLEQDVREEQARETAAAVLAEVDRVMPGPGPRGREGWKDRIAEKFRADPHADPAVDE
jgi:hypothetical protein